MCQREKKARITRCTPLRLLITKSCMFYFFAFPVQHESIVRKLIQGPRVRSLFHQVMYLFFFFPSRSFIPLLFVSHGVFANAASAVIKCGPGAYLNNSSPSFIIADAEVHFLAIICQHNITITVVAVYPCRNLLFISYIFDEKGYNTLIYKLYCLIIWNKKV